MTFSPDLLATYAPDRKTNSAFHATTEAHGLYNTQQFVLRLSPLIHRALASYTPGIVTNGQIGLDGAQAMSTYLHETIHWWQHIGSTYGFILSLNYPVQAHCTHFDLKKLVEEDGFKKSIFLQAIELNRNGSSGVGTMAGRANTIVNNHYDLLAFRAFTLGPEAAKEVTQANLFESVGHAFHMTYAHTLNILASSVDPNFGAIPHPKEWSDGFRALNEGKVEGYYYGSPVGLWPIGAYEIFEGQARFSQIQYLSHACGHRLDWDSYRDLGMLNGVYTKAFELFLKLTETEWPSRVDHPLVGLFLLICDLAINPGSGFPLPVTPNFRSFIHDVNPGARFCTFCRLIVLRRPAMKQAVHAYSRSEYESVTSELCELAKEPSPLLNAHIFSDWFAQSGPLSHVRGEYVTYVFQPVNYVIRHLFAHFLAFQEDKFRIPELFCWPGAWMAGEYVSQEAVRMFEKHGALFVDREDDDGVFARQQPGRDEATLQAAFDGFYHTAVTYDLTNQWISRHGPFDYNIGWLSSSATPSDAKEYLRRQFTGAFGFDPETASILLPDDGVSF